MNFGIHLQIKCIILSDQFTLERRVKEKLHTPPAGVTCETDRRCSSHQGSGEAKDGEQSTGGGEGGVFAHSGLFPHLHVGSCDVISQLLWDHRLSLLTQSNVTSAGILFCTILTLWN